MEPHRQSQENQSIPARRKHRAWRTASRALLALVLSGMLLWGVMAIWWSNLPSVVRPIAAILFGLTTAGTLILARPRRRGILVFGAAFAAMLVWWLRIPPSNDRDWLPDVAVLAGATFDGNRVTIHNIRNCDYRSETDFDVHHYDRTFDVDKLRTVDLYVVYWGSPLIAHTMLSFGFDGDQYVCISIETRKEKGEEYSAIKGFFKQYELVYVVGDERDLVRLRTNYRGETVYLYRLQTRPEMARQVFLDYLHEVDALNRAPEWYNALTANCTTSIRGHTTPYVERPRWSWKLIVNGYVDEMVYENGALDQRLPFADLKGRSLINDRARMADQDPAFSRRIREGLPGCE